MARFELRVIPRPGEYGSSKEMGKRVELQLSGTLACMHVGVVSLDEPNLSGLMRCTYDPRNGRDFITVPAVDENFCLDIFFEKDEKRKFLADMLITNVDHSKGSIFSDRNGNVLATLFVRSWLEGPEWNKPRDGAKFIEGLQVDTRVARFGFEVTLKNPSSDMIHPPIHFIGSDPMYLHNPPLEGQQEPMQ